MEFPCKDCIVLPVCKEPCELTDVPENEYVYLMGVFLLYKCCPDCGHDYVYTPLSDVNHWEILAICARCRSRMAVCFTSVVDGGIYIARSEKTHPENFPPGSLFGITPVNHFIQDMFIPKLEISIALELRNKED
jgi:hypothetical protein